MKHTPLKLNKEQLYILQQAGIRISKKKYIGDVIEVEADITKQAATNLLLERMAGPANKKVVCI